MSTPKNILDFPKLPQRPNRFKRFSDWFTLRRIFYFSAGLAAANVLLATLDEEVNRLETFGTMMLMELIGMPLVCMLLAAGFSLLLFFMVKREDLVFIIALCLYNLINVFMFLGILYDLLGKLGVDVYF